MGEMKMGLRTALGLKKPKEQSPQLLRPTPPSTAPHAPLRDLPIDIDETGMEFTYNFPRIFYPKWNAALEDHKGCFNRILEIGSHEGRSANILLQILPHSHITCIDRFYIEDRVARFDANLARYGDRVRKITGYSNEGLSNLIFEGQSYEVIYIDGSHKRSDVYIDSLLCWELLAPGGIVIWDDYMWKPENADADRPHNAINRFLDRYGRELVILHKNLQVIAKRTSPAIS
jgi:hypothetical protein